MNSMSGTMGRGAQAKGFPKRLSVAASRPQQKVQKYTKIEIHELPPRPATDGPNPAGCVESPALPAQSLHALPTLNTEAFREALGLVDLAETAGLDSVWLGEMHFNPGRSVLSAPIVVASAIATRTTRLKVGMAVQVLPLISPLRLAEEAATVDQLSEGRFEYGVGRSGNMRAYDTMGIPYEESSARFQEALDIILQAWKGDTFSYHGKYNHIENASLSPLPYQKPHPPVRLASTTEDSFARVGRLGFPIFLSMRAKLSSVGGGGGDGGPA